MHKLRTLHLFAGAGGGLLADLLLGHQCVGAVEINPYCQQVLSARQKDGIFPWFPIFGDITEFDGRPWRGLVEVVAGGFPCQNISPSGDRQGLSGEKSGLWSEQARVVREVEPIYVLVENSAALLVRGINIVLSDLAKMGFDAEWCVLGATDAIWIDGTPAFDHERFRIFIKATHPDRLRKLQSKRRKQDQRRRVSDRVEKVAYTNCIRQQSADAAKEFQIHANRNNAPLKQARRGVSVPITASDNFGWWTHEPTVGRVVHGLANRDYRIGVIGNGQVPAVVALAWHYLK